MNGHLEIMSSRCFTFLCMILFIVSGSLSYSWLSFHEVRGVESPVSPSNLRRTPVEWISSTPKELRAQPHTVSKLDETTPTSSSSNHGDIRLNAELDFEFYKIVNSRKLESRFGGDGAAMIAFLRWLQSSRPELFAGDLGTADILRRYRIAEDIDEKRKLIDELHISNQKNDLVLESILKEYHRLIPPSHTKAGSPASSDPPPPPKTLQ